MQKTIYFCDHDGKEIGRTPHITLFLEAGTATGIAVPNEQTSVRWTTHTFGKNFLHFHNGKCAGGWLQKKITEALQKEKKHGKN